MARNFVLLVCVALSFLALYSFLSTQSEHLSAPPKANSLTEIDCPLHESPCEVGLGAGVIALSLSPNGLPALQRLQLTISSPGSDLEDIIVWLEGRDMDMGRHYFERGGSENHHDFRGMIPVCTIDQGMIWRLHVILSVNGEFHELVVSMPAGKRSQEIETRKSPQGNQS